MHNKYFISIILIFFKNIAFAQCPVNIDLSTQIQVDSFLILYPQCHHITGFLWIHGQDIENLNGLKNIDTISGALIITETTKIKNLSGLDQLKYVGKSFQVWQNNKLESLQGLNQLTYIGAQCDINRNPELTSIAALGKVKRIGEYIKLYRLPLLESYQGMESIDTIHGDLYTTLNPRIKNFDGFQNLQFIWGGLYAVLMDSLVNFSGLNQVKHIGAFVTIIENTSLENLQGLSSLQSIENELYVVNNRALLSTAGMESCESIGGSLQLRDNYALESVSGFKSLKYVGYRFMFYNLYALKSLEGLENLNTINAGGLYLYSDTSLVNLDPLKNLTYVRGKLWIVTTNKQFHSIDGLQNVQQDSLTELMIVDNHDLKICHIKPVCEYLLTTKPRNISENAQGCFDESQVLNGCINATNGPNSEVTINVTTDNSSKRLIINLPDKGKYIIQIHNLLGGELHTSHIEYLDQVSLNTNSYPLGYYVCTITNHKSEHWNHPFIIW